MDSRERNESIKALTELLKVLDGDTLFNETQIEKLRASTISALEKLTAEFTAFKK